MDEETGDGADTSPSPPRQRTADTILDGMDSVDELMAAVLAEYEDGRLDEEDLPALVQEMYQALTERGPADDGAERADLDVKAPDTTVLAVCALVAERDRLWDLLTDVPALDERRGTDGARVFEHDGDVKCVLKAAGKAGNRKIADVTRAMVRAYDPDYVVLFGIAAGAEERVELTDTIIADRVIDLRVHSVEDDGYSFDADAIDSPGNLNVPVRIAKLAADRAGYSAEEFEIHTDLHIGSSNNLVRDETFMNDAKAVNRKLGGVEMEAAGVAEVCAEVDAPFFVVKTVHDYGTVDKDDSEREVCLDLAAKTVLHGFLAE